MANQECCGGYQVAKFLLDEEKNTFAPISGRASVTETLLRGSIPCLAFNNKKGPYEYSSVCGRQVDKT